MLQIPTSLKSAPEALNSPAAIKAYDDFAAAAARDSFWTYRKHMPAWDWLPRRLARELRRFYDDLVAGRRPILVLATPPQHGKSFAVIDFIAWAVGHNADLRVSYTSFSDRLSIRANLRMQRALDSERYQRIFPGTRAAPTLQRRWPASAAPPYICSAAVMRNLRPIVRSRRIRSASA